MSQEFPQIKYVLLSVSHLLKKKKTNKKTYTLLPQRLIMVSCDKTFELTSVHSM